MKNEVWIAQYPTWMNYLHGLASVGAGIELGTNDPDIHVREISILTVDKTTHDTLKDVSAIILEYRKKGV